MSVISTLKNIFKVKKLRNQLLVTFLILTIFRFTAHIPVPGIDQATLQRLFSGSAFLSLLDLFSGGTLANLSIMALGVNPFINASIILQMMSMVIPQLEKLREEGQYGQEKINQYTRWLTIPLSIIQSFGLITLLRSQGIAIISSPLQLITIIVTLTTGTLLLTWLGELITEYGIGNGVSVIIFAGIVGRLPISLFQTTATTQARQTTNLLVFAALAIAVIYFVVKITQAQREITVQYARRSRNQSTPGGQMSHLPLRLNQAGVIPIIFAVSLMLLPSMVGNFLTSVANPTLANIGYFFANKFTPDSFLYNGVYFVLVVAFTFFYTAVVFDPDKISEQLKKNGGFIPGVRPGTPTAKYLSYILTRITAAGAVFLGLIAVLPNLAQQITNIQSLAIGGTGLLIVVSVVLETTKDVQAQLVMRNYDKFL